MAEDKKLNYRMQCAILIAAGIVIGIVSDKLEKIIHIKTLWL
jgi:hypothetical protein